MGKVNMPELADLLAQKAGISKREAQQFLSALVETIQDGVNDDKLVKIKGLGTFKVIDVDARESVNVNTGERVTIDSHQKLSFTPDSAMKELVNRPFSQFETVILNEGVEFDDDLEEEPSPTEEEETPAPVAETPAPVAETPAPVAETPAPVKEDPVVVEEEKIEEKEETIEENIEVEDNIDIDMTEEKKESSYWWAWLLLAIAACAASFVAGYLYGRHVDRASLLEEEQPADTTVVAAPVVTDTLKTDTLQIDTIQQATPQADTLKAEPAKEEKVEAPKPEPEPEWKKYEKMDVRVRTGAYGIIGFDRKERVRPGDTTKRIAKRTLGEGMECYIEVYNNVKTEDLKEGQTVNIPKLKLKKFLKTKSK